MLSSEPFLGCARLVNTSSYLEACRHDLCHCSRVNLTSCLCHTLAEYSRQCAHAGGLPLDWRGPQLCRECPSGPGPALLSPQGGGRAGCDTAHPPPRSPDVPPEHAVPRVRLTLCGHLLQPWALPAVRGPLCRRLLLPRG